MELGDRTKAAQDSPESAPAACCVAMNEALAG